MPFEPGGFGPEGGDSESWRKDNMHVGIASSAIYLAPIVWKVLLDENWAYGIAITGVLGVWFSPGVWRKLLGLVWSIFLMFYFKRVGALYDGYAMAGVLLFWYYLFAIVCNSDKRARSARPREDW